MTVYDQPPLSIIEFLRVKHFLCPGSFKKIRKNYMNLMGLSGSGHLSVTLRRVSFVDSFYINNFTR